MTYNNKLFYVINFIFLKKKIFKKQYDPFQKRHPVQYINKALLLQVLLEDPLLLLPSNLCP